MVDIADVLALLDEHAITPTSSLVRTPATDTASVFLEDLYEWMETDERRREADDPSYLRASGLYKVCARRESFLMERPAMRVVEAFSPGRRMNFDVGHALHWWWQNRYLGPMGRLWGNWFCARCDKVVTQGLMPKRCPGCNQGYKKVLTYEELSLKDERLKYTAHPDGLLVDAPGPPRLLFELKTKKPEGFETLKKPDGEHRIQVHAYMRPLGVREALITYVDKGKQTLWKVMGGRIVPVGIPRVKVFHVLFDDGLWADIERRILDYWRAKDGAPPEDLCRICPSPTSSFARICPARDDCFSRRAP